jgi:hypothetical protein
MFTKPDFYIDLNTIDKVKRFSAKTSKCEYDIVLSTGRYIVDGKSIMGIFSLNLSNEIGVHISDKKGLEDFKNNFAEFIKL